MTQAVAEEIINLFLDPDSLSGEVEIVRESASLQIVNIVDRYTSSLIRAFKDTAIKAHIGFKHEGSWEKCEWIECEDRRNMIRGG